MNGIEISPGKVWGLRLLVVLAAGLLLARLGPFGTFRDLPTGARLAYWVGLTLLMWLQCLAALSLLGSTVLRRQPRLVLLLLAAVAGAVPTAFEVAWAEMLLRVSRDLSLVDVLKIYGDVLLLAVPLLLLTHLICPSGAVEPEGRVAGEGVDWLVGKLPPQRRGRLVAVNSEDHYLRVRTTAGSDLVHMRFSDAVARLGDAGVQVHRSWWVAHGGVRAQQRDGDRILLELVDGTTAPISRSYVLAARQAGLIAG